MKEITGIPFGLLDARFQAKLTFPLAASLGGTGIANGASATLTLPDVALTLAAAGAMTITFPETLTVAGRDVANTFTVAQMIDSTADAIELQLQAHSTKTTGFLTFEKSDGTVWGGADERGILFSHGGGNSQSLYIGNDAGKSSAVGRNTGGGWRALSSLTTGSGNNAWGENALRLCSSGANNNGVGAGALEFLTVGSSNNAMGSYALYSLVSGGSNSAQGTGALYSLISGDSNAAIGVNAGRYIANGSSPNTTGYNSIFIGQNTKALANGEFNQIVIGYGATGNGTNTVTIGHTDIVGSYFNGQLYVTRRATDTGAILDVARLEAIISTANTGGAAGFGPGLGMLAETATDGTSQEVAFISAPWVDPVNATRKGKLQFWATDTARRLGIEIEADGSAAKIGVLGATPIVRQAHIVNADGSLADVTSKFNSLLVYFENFGFIATS